MSKNQYVAIIDYDAGNIKSVEKAIEYLGEKSLLTRNPEEILKADKVILPGVGNFGDAMEKLEKYGLIQVIRDFIDTGKPFLGICLGLQLLFEGSDESPSVKGLSILDGYIHRIPNTDTLKVPNIGWNSLTFPNEGKLFSDIEEGSFVYFVHSFYLKASDPSIVKAQIDYGVKVDASVEKDNVFACQFHPEKSSEIGLKIIKNFLEL